MKKTSELILGSVTLWTFRVSGPDCRGLSNRNSSSPTGKSLMESEWAIIKMTQRRGDANLTSRRHLSKREPLCRRYTLLRKTRCRHMRAASASAITMCHVISYTPPLPLNPSTRGTLSNSLHLITRELTSTPLLTFLWDANKSSASFSF